MRFRDHLPDNCPPLDATSPVIEVYCLVDNPPVDTDFLSLRERNPEREYGHSLECQACGLSVFTDIPSVELAKKVSRRLRKKAIALGHLSEDSGQIKRTPSKSTGDTHHTWWPAQDIAPCDLFQVIPHS